MDRRRWLHRLNWILLYLLLSNVCSVFAVEDYLVHPLLKTNLYQDERESKREVCRGMYAKNAMGGNIDPYIHIVFNPINGDTTQLVSLVIFAWVDVYDVGIPDDEGGVVTPPRKFTYDRGCISATTSPWAVDCVLKSTMGSLLCRIRLNRGVYIPVPSTSPILKVSNITSKTPIITVLQR